MSEKSKETGSVKVGDLIKPTGISIEMMEFSRPSGDDMWHWTNNLSAMLRLGYCRKCGLVPNGCRREGCRAEAKASRDGWYPAIEDFEDLPCTASNVLAVLINVGDGLITPKEGYQVLTRMKVETDTKEFSQVVSSSLHLAQSRPNSLEDRGRVLVLGEVIARME